MFAASKLASLDDTVPGFGAQLRTAREARKETIETIAESLSINPRTLEALEAENIYVLPAAPHALGFLRAYAAHLQLAPEPLVEQLKRQYGLHHELKTFKSGREGRGLPWKTVAAVTAGTALVAVMAWELGRRQALESLPAMAMRQESVPAPVTTAQNPAAPLPEAQQPGARLPDSSLMAAADAALAPATVPEIAGTVDAAPLVAPQAATQGVPPVEAAMIQPPSAVAAPDVETASAPKMITGAIAPGSQATLPPAVQTAAPQAPSAAPPPLIAGPEAGGTQAAAPVQNVAPLPAPAMAAVNAATPPAAADNAPLILKAAGNSWVEVRRSNGVAVWKDMMRKGDTYTLPEIPGLKMKLGSAGVMTLERAGVESKPLGKPGHVVRVQVDEKTLSELFPARTAP